MKFDINKVLPCFHYTLITSFTAASILHARHHIESSAYDGVIPDDVIEEMVCNLIERYDLSNLWTVLSRKREGDETTPPLKCRKFNYDREHA
jgi:hypothetical protein